MWQIIDGLFIGTDEDARNLTCLKEHKIRHIINCAVELDSYHPREFAYTRLELKDPDGRFRQTVDTAVRTIKQQIKMGSVLVHCHGALSRSPAVVLAYLCARGMPLPSAAQCVSAVLPTRPNAVFLDQLIERFPTAYSAAELHEVLASSAPDAGTAES